MPELLDVLAGAGIVVLERSWQRVEIRGVSVGVVGTKGFVGGFPDSQLPDFGEPLLREVYAETSADVAGLEAGLVAIDDCDLRLVLLHYAPTTTTLVGEPEVIWAFLGTDRLAEPIAAHSPTSSFMDTATAAPSRARSATSPSTTSRRPSWAVTSGRSS